MKLEESDDVRLGTERGSTKKADCQWSSLLCLSRSISTNGGCRWRQAEETVARLRARDEAVGLPAALCCYPVIVDVAVAACSHRGAVLTLCRPELDSLLMILRRRDC